MGYTYQGVQEVHTHLGYIGRYTPPGYSTPLGIPPGYSTPLGIPPGYSTPWVYTGWCISSPWYPGGIQGVLRCPHGTRETCWVLYAVPWYPGSMLGVKEGELYAERCSFSVLKRENSAQRGAHSLGEMLKDGERTLRRLLSVLHVRKRELCADCSHSLGEMLKDGEKPLRKEASFSSQNGDNSVLFSPFLSSFLPETPVKPVGRREWPALTPVSLLVDVSARFFTFLPV